METLSQSLNINSQMAIAAGEMVHFFAKFSAKADAGGGGYFRGSMNSTWIAQENIDRVVERAIAVIGRE